KETVKEEEFDLATSFTPAPSHIGLNPRYTLQSFMVGLSNNLAYAAAQAVIQNPGLSYNPLFVYGGTGVGKTHLMHAIGNELLSKNPRLKIIYCSSERFMNDLIQSIQTKRTGDFRARYRACDLLLIDDIQFISGRDSTQEEFFHTFNELQTKNSQIVLTSDRPPNEIQKLEGRLASRFQGGLMVDIQLPDFDTRVAILKAKCSERGDSVSESILTIIAENMPTNARELEGKLVQIVQGAKLTGQILTEDSVKKVLGQPTQPTGGQKPDYKKVISAVIQYFSIKMSEITGPRRKKGLVLPRQLAMYLLYEECKLPYEKIGDLLGGRDHTTIMHGVEKMREAVTRDREIQRMLIEIKQSLVG
ncbi:MAG: chromosomal replication initiator protein DnaA, partial [bacterium]|nr:chromosomal replication initiator protein DnaA [bacterium]